MTKIKTTTNIFIVSFLLLSGSLFSGMFLSVQADTHEDLLTEENLTRPPGPDTGSCSSDELRIAIPVGESGECVDRDEALNIYLRGIVQFLTVGVGLTITLMIVLGGIQYAGAAGNPQAIEAAKKKIYHALEALLLFIFTAAILNFLIPGGLL